jgi:phosphotransferase system  glucose/maltose/N-acetylglucosamine-specific IIC component
MSSSKPQRDFVSIDPADLTRVAGGARVSSRANSSNDQLTQLLTQVTDSIKSLASQQQGSDPMQMMMMMMMMMMGGLGGRGGAAPAAAMAAPPPAPPPVINVAVNGRRC